VIRGLALAMTLMFACAASFAAPVGALRAKGHWRELIQCDEACAALLEQRERANAARKKQEELLDQERRQAKRQETDRLLSLVPRTKILRAASGPESASKVSN
jgi:hypothetical protein